MAIVLALEERMGRRLIAEEIASAGSVSDFSAILRREEAPPVKGWTR
jgi:hypothetical protein